MGKVRVVLTYGMNRIPLEIPEENFLYAIEPRNISGVIEERKAIQESLQHPIFASPLCEQVRKGMKVVIVGDDLTRATPREKIFPVLLDELNRGGVPDRDITVLIGLGTHRYMTQEEIEKSFGKETTERVFVLNHEWKEPQNLVRMGSTPGGVPIEVNRLALEADFLIAVGSIIPHCYAGYGGGGKAIQPGICSWETTGKTHILPMERDLYLKIAGQVENDVRREIEIVAEAVGLRFIVNVVTNGKDGILQVVAGDPVVAHRKGVETAKRVYERKIPALADIVVVSAYPADIDYWQGIKPLSYAQKGLREGGSSILVAPFPEGISPVHSDLKKFATLSYQELKKMVQNGTFEDLVCAATLLLHAKIMEHSREVICVSDGLSLEDKEALGFKHAGTVQEALEIALKTQGREARVGIIDCGGDTLPEI
ncbi:MAG: nickel-dependent lactate racemase [Candidatus Caldatribacteriaceae bacterium]